MNRLRGLVLYLALKALRIENVVFPGHPDWMPQMPEEKESKADELAYHYVCELSVVQRNKLLSLVRATSDMGNAAKRQLLDALQLAERLPGTVKDKLDWDKAAKELGGWDEGLKDFIGGGK